MAPVKRGIFPMVDRAVGHVYLVGQSLGHYRVLEKVGEGGMGQVYRGRDEHLARDVAIKVFPPGTLVEENERKRFRKEAQTLSQLNHPNIATIYDFDTFEGIDFLAMEYIAGETLSDRVASGPLSGKDISRLGTQLAEGLVAGARGRGYSLRYQAGKSAGHAGWPAEDIRLRTCQNHPYCKNGCDHCQPQ